MGKRTIILKAFLSFLFLFVLPAKAQAPGIDPYLKTTLDAYAKIKDCDVSDIDTSSMSSLKGVCQTVVDSPVCADIDPDYLLDCDNIFLSEDIIPFMDGVNYDIESGDDLSSNPAWSCLKGIGTGIVDLFGAVVYMFQAMGAAAVEPFFDFEWSTEILNNIASMGNYYMTEYDKEYIEGNSNFPFFSALASMINKALSDKYTEFGCLSAEGKTKVICQVGLDAAALIGLGVVGAGTGAIGSTIGTGLGVARGTITAIGSPIQTVRRAGRAIKTGTPVVGRRARRARAAKKDRKEAAQEAQISSRASRRAQAEFGKIEAKTVTDIRRVNAKADTDVAKAEARLAQAEAKGNTSRAAKIRSDIAAMRAKSAADVRVIAAQGKLDIAKAQTKLDVRQARGRGEKKKARDRGKEKERQAQVELDKAKTDRQGAETQARAAAATRETEIKNQRDAKNREDRKNEAEATEAEARASEAQSRAREAEARAAAAEKDAGRVVEGEVITPPAPPTPRQLPPPSGS